MSTTFTDNNFLGTSSPTTANPPLPSAWFDSPSLWREGRDRRGLFLSFEGGEGVGKSTQVNLLMKHWKDSGRPILHVREPGGTPVGEVIRHLLKHHQDNVDMVKEAELLLFAASRAQLVREKIKPALARGGLVIADRFLDSTTVYQGTGRVLPADMVEAINRFAVGDCLPDLTFLLDLDALKGLERARGREENVRDRMEEAESAFYLKVRQGYLDLAQHGPDAMRFQIIDASQSVTQVHQQILTALAERSLL